MLDSGSLENVLPPLSTATRAMIQLVQLPLHAVLILLVWHVSRKVRNRTPWHWLLVALGITLSRKVLALWSLEELYNVPALIFIDRGVTPTVVAFCTVVWAGRLLQDLENTTEGFRRAA